MIYDAPEPICHGTAKKNIAFYLHDNYEPGILKGTYAPHWHSEYEVVYVSDGIASFLLNGKLFQVNAGEALFINKNAIHACTSPSNQHVRFMCIVFGEQFVFSNTSDYLYEKYFLPLQLSNKEFPSLICGNTEWELLLLDTLKYLWISGQKPLPGCEITWRIKLLEFFHIAYTYDIFIEGNWSQSKSIITIRDILTYIEKNYTEQISIPALARQAGFSTEYFCRIFKMMVQKTPVEYIIACRIEQAKYLLTHTTDSISSIATASGFNDVNYFSRCFKKLCAITAKQYRREFS